MEESEGDGRSDGEKGKARELHVSTSVLASKDNTCHEAEGTNSTAAVDVFGEHSESSCEAKPSLEVGTSQKKGLKVIVCPSCKTELYPWRHKFCYECGEKIEGSVSSVLQREGNSTSGTLLSNPSRLDPHPSKVVVAAGDVEPVKQLIRQEFGRADSKLTESQQQLATVTLIDRNAGEAQKQGMRKVRVAEQKVMDAEENGEENKAETYDNLNEFNGNTAETKGFSVQSSPDPYENTENSKDFHERGKAEDSGVVTEAEKVGVQSRPEEHKRDEETRRVDSQNLVGTGQNTKDIEQLYGQGGQEVDNSHSKNTHQATEDTKPEPDELPTCEVKPLCGQSLLEDNKKYESTDQINVPNEADVDENNAAAIQPGTRMKPNVNDSVSETKQLGKQNQPEAKQNHGQNEAESDNGKLNDNANPQQTKRLCGINKPETDENAEDTKQFCEQNRAGSTDLENEGTPEGTDELGQQSLLRNDENAEDMLQFNRQRESETNKNSTGIQQLGEQTKQEATKKDDADELGEERSRTSRRDGDQDKVEDERRKHEHKVAGEIPEAKGKTSSNERSYSDVVRSKTLLQIAQEHPLSSGDQATTRGGEETGGEPPGHFYRKEDSHEEYIEGRQRLNPNRTSQTRNPTTKPKLPPKMDKVDKGITIVFHAILSGKFKRDKDNMHVCIRGDRPIFDGWDHNSVDITQVKTLKHDHVLLRGQIIVSLALANRKVPYKYVVVTKGKPQYEELVEFTSLLGDITNRCLAIPKEFVKENATWDKYDGFVYPEPGILGFFSYGVQKEDRREFVKELFPKWGGFHVTTHDCHLPPVAAVQQLDNLLKSISSVWIKRDRGTSFCSNISPKDLRLSEVIRDFLAPKIHQNLNALSSGALGVQSAVGAIVSSVVITHAFHRHSVRLGDEMLEKLLKCMKLPPSQVICDALLEEMEQFEDNLLSTVSESICSFFDNGKLPDSLIVDWLHTLPLLHFLRGNSKPFTELDGVKSIEYSKWRWWGLTKIDVRHIRRRITTRGAVEMLPDLSSLFEMDRLLPRSFLLLSPIEVYRDLLGTGHFSVFEVCATLRRILPDEGSSSYTEPFQRYLADLFLDVNKKLSVISTEAVTLENQHENKALLRTFVTLLDSLRPHLSLRHIDVLCRGTEGLITLIKLLSDGTECQTSSEEKKNNEMLTDNISLKDIPEYLVKFLKEALGIVNRFFKDRRELSLQYSRDMEVNQELQAWNELLSVEAPCCFREIWHDTFKRQLKDRISKVTPIRAIEIFCQSDEQKCHTEVATCLSDAAFKAVDEIVKPGRGEQVKAFGFLTDKATQKCVDLLNRMLRKAWPLGNEANEDDDKLLKHLLTWPTWPGFLQFFGSCSSNKLILPDDGVVMMIKVESCVENLILSIQNGSVPVSTLEILETYSTQFLKLGKIFQENKRRVGGDVKVNQIPIEKSFKQRTDELKLFRVQRKQFSYFIDICDVFDSIDVRLRALRHKLRMDWSTLRINELCVRGPSGIVVVFFDLEPEVQQMVSKIYGIQNSRIFNDLWHEFCKKLQGGTVKLEDVVRLMWSPIRENLLSIKQQFISGEMQIKKVDVFLKTFKYKCDELEREFELLLVNFRDPETRLESQKHQLRFRIQQINDYRKLFDAGIAARSITDLKKAMNLTGDFSEVESIAEIIGGSFATQPIKSVSPELLEAGRLLEGITNERAICLTTFSKCHDLVKWLKENIRDQQALKVFVDLAMISAGESDMEIDRISFMHTSCLGFSSLIFGLKSQDGFQRLMTLSKPVWQAMDANPTLAEKLEFTSQNLAWLKQIKESHGSVALTTLMQVETINASGVYHIADFELLKSRRSGAGNDEVCLENTICLVVPGDHEKKREKKIYSLEEVKDVQSKLMLIAGKAGSGKDEVDQFTEVFEGVIRVSNLYVELCEVGEISYLTWKMEFKSSNTASRREELLSSINKTCLEMEKRLQEWKKQIDEIRKDYYSLNHFTMKQILKLRKHLASACIGQVGIDELPLQIFMLLESVCKDVEPFILANVLDTVIPENAGFISEKSSDDRDYFRKESEEAEVVPDEVALEAQPEIRPCISKRINSAEAFNKARETLEGMGYGEDIIVASLRACGRGAMEEDLVLWVINNGDDNAEVEMLYQEALEDPEFSDMLNEFIDMDYNQIESVNNKREDVAVAKKRSPSPYANPILLDQIDFAKGKHIPETVEIYVRNKKDTYLSLPTLAAVLARLANSERKHSTPRKFPSNLKEDEPNLLLVPQGEIFASILTLFMGDGTQTLPTDEEVIVCDENTTAEEVELLWQRAVVDKSGLLFCLANADLLDYDVSQQAVRALEYLTQGESSYHLVVVCSIENEDKSNMVASLDQFRRQFPPMTSLRTLQLYLKRELAAPREKRIIGGVQWHAAGTVDKDRLSVRVVESSRAGVGKSLVVERLTRKLDNLPNNKRLRLEYVSSLCQAIPVHGVSVDSDEVTRAFLTHAVKQDIPVSRIFHLDISQSVIKGLDALLFNLLILKTIKDSNGYVWRRKTTDMYVIEVTTDRTFPSLVTDEIVSQENYSQNGRKRPAATKYSFLKFLPRIHCLTPRETLFNIQQNQNGDTEFDMEKFRSVEYQRTFQYLKLFDAGVNLDNFTFQRQQQTVIGDPMEALKIAIKYCGMRDPSWAELHHFVSFLNSQLHDCEESIFCNTELVGDLLQGFRTFVVRFMIQMSRDFATRSLSDGNLTADDTQKARDEEDDLIPFQIRRRWEQSPHPYIFFNQDRHSMTFLGFLLSGNGDLLNPVNNEILEPRLMDPTLRGQLKVQGVDFDKNYETWDRMTRITNLCSVMGIGYLYDPDSNYELTTDNVEKILAIHMRFRSGIPVIIMGETGCGKTRLIRFMCELQSGPGGPKNMLLMKVHGGTSYKDIENKVKEAEELARVNNEKNVDTVLFFDEANTTDAIDLIKEIMVDKRVNGKPIHPDLYRLHFIAACNPYRKHTDEMIHKLESAGLGYHVSADETQDKLGSIPLRQLVYRVHPLPESMRPLVWDFGQLTDHTEELYTRQIVRRYFVTPTRRVAEPVKFPHRSAMKPKVVLRTTKLHRRSEQNFETIHSHPVLSRPGPSTSNEELLVHPTQIIPNQPGPSTSHQVSPDRKTEFIHGNDSQASCIATVLSASQKYMRKQNNECSFVSLRDVERAMKVITWFYVNADLISNILNEPGNNHSGESSVDDSDEETKQEEIQQPANKIVRALILGIGVCYYARLYNRNSYCKYIARYFTETCPLPGGAEWIMKEISRCQHAFLNNIELGDNIARNTALSENVFMMAICTELRIPLFVVGKPGSSKSLAKDVISTHMKGGASQSELFQNLKQIHMQSYQCSPLSTPEGIVSTFKQCSKLQKDKDLSKFVSVVVLDEIGLAEDSPLMPLKTLHPLLEDGTATEEVSSSGKPLEHLRVGFIGLSNWALDPAKMNRGIMLSRGVPTIRELIDSAKGICSSDEHVQRRIEPTIHSLANGYFKLYSKQKNSETLQRAKKEEFFGLRDFYSLVKMVYGFAAESDDHQIDSLQLEQAIRRNFSGLDDLNPIEIFSCYCPLLRRCVKYPSPQSQPISLIDQSLHRTKAEGESRYLLVLTENYAALRILQQQFLKGEDHDPVVIFGSSFPKDQHYTQICRNINRIKVCMETGRMVILLNLESLYESLYDALNQYYLYLAGQKYVDLGLGSHRVKCRVADNFKLIVIAEKEVVYQRFPIPLINRLEKHFLVVSTGLTSDQARLVSELETWVRRFSDAKPEYSRESSFKPGDSFVGYHSDTAAAVIMKVSKHLAKDEEILTESQYSLLQCASPDAIARLTATELKPHAEELWEFYFKIQKHKSLVGYLEHVLGALERREDGEGLLVQITTHSRLLSQSNAKTIATAAGFPGSRSRCISLQEFHTEQQFTKTIQNFFVTLGGSEGLLLVQCDNGEANFNLIACSRYLVVDTRRHSLEDTTSPVKPIHIIFVIQLPKIAGGCQNFVGFQGGKWKSVHIDELLESSERLPRIDQLVNRSVSELLKPLDGLGSEDAEEMDVDDDFPNENANTSSADYSAAGRINPNIVLRNCLQAAAARVYDESVNVNRATRRIEILLDFLTEDDLHDTDFSSVLVKRVYQLLQERDEKCWQDQKMWLQNEALCRGRLQETGTFRKALWQKLSSIVSPVLSEVIAYADRNQNLSLVKEDKNWKKRLWFVMFNDKLITSLHYESFISPVSQVIRERACVVSSGIGHHFQCKFPFSWIIKDMVNVLLTQVEAHPSKTAVLNSLRSVIDSSPLGALLKPLKEDSDVKEEATMDYLHDFVHMVYKPTVDKEVELVSDALISAARGVHPLLNTSDEFELDIALIHFAHSLIQVRLSCFADLVHACPNVVKKLFGQRQRLNIDEMILDVVALECCLSELEPTSQELKLTEQRSIWCNRVQSVRPAMQVMARLVAARLEQESRKDSQLDSQVYSIGETSKRFMHHCRSGWVRLGVVRLFIEHTCPPGVQNHPSDEQNAFKLWKALGENPDFSSVETITVIERFLNECSERVSKRYTKYGINHCAVCQSKLEEPIEMPCEHICCSSCARSWFADRNTCPICRQEVGGGFKVVINQECRQSIEEYNSFRNRCKSFFMELVALYCFGEESRQSPNPQLVRKFIRYVIKEGNRTEDFTPFDGQGIDTTPVVRSFILQQLLAHKGKDDQVREHLEDYLRRAGGLADQRDHMIEVCVLCVQCMEDTEIMKLLKCKEAGEDNQILMATRTLESSLQVFSIGIRTPPNVFNVNSLQTVAATRAAIDVLSTFLGEDYASNRQQYKNFSAFLQVTRNLCTYVSRSPIRLFLLKQLVRKHGIDFIKEKCRNEELQWILPAQNKQKERAPDSFIVHHANYHEVREALAKAILTCSTDELELLLQDLLAAPTARDCYILLSLFREVTTSYAMSDIQERTAAKVLEKLRQFIGDTGHLSNELKPLADRILTNTHYGNVNLLRVTPGQSGSESRLAEVLTHFRIILDCLPHNPLLQPLRNLAANPAVMRNAFLPTMPHDYGAEAMQVNIGRWYECPNGHRYVITECGNPNQNYTCPVCHSQIGGMGRLAERNRDASREDRSSTGHILGPAQAQQQSLASERNLTPLACGVLRFLTHAAMMLGADHDIQNVIHLIKPRVANVIQFLLAHLVHDIRCLARSTGNNEDEVMQIMHLVFVVIINNQTQQQQGHFNLNPTLSSKDSRTAWENAFVSTYVNPVLSNLSQQLQDSFGRMVRDERLGNDPLMRQLYELDSPNYDIMDSLDSMCPALWRYRTRVSVEHLTVKFQEYVEGRAGSNRCEILGEFLKKEHLLRALQYLPDVLKLQRQLSEKFHRRLDRSEAEKFTLGDFLRRASQLKKQFSELVNSFRMAWKLVRSSLSQNGRLSIPNELCALEITHKTPISMFLPTNSGLGRCALGMTSFLVTLHNEFIGRCKTLLEDDSSSDDVPLVNVTKAHLVAFDPEKDLLPIILAHSDYSLKVGEGTIVEYNLKGLEKQLVDRFIRGRARLTSMVELFVFSKDVCDGEVFTSLKQKIHQVELSRTVQDQILNELNQLTDICDVLKSLHIAIGFLSSAGGQPTMLISEYLHSGLKMSDNDGLKSSKAEQVCQIRHIISLWRLLSLERARVLTRHKQDPFDDISEKVKKQLTRKQIFELCRGLQKLNVDQFILELLEAILLFLKHVPAEQLHFPLSDYLNAKLDEKGSDEIVDLDQYLPQDILLEHAVETWKIACQKSEDYYNRAQ